MKQLQPQPYAQDEILKYLGSITGTTKSLSKRMVQAIADLVLISLIKGRGANIPRLGKFQLVCDDDGNPDVKYIPANHLKRLLAEGIRLNNNSQSGEEIGSADS